MILGGLQDQVVTKGMTNMDYVKNLTSKDKETRRLAYDLLVEDTNPTWSRLKMAVYADNKSSSSLFYYDSSKTRHNDLLPDDKVQQYIDIIGNKIFNIEEGIRDIPVLSTGINIDTTIISNANWKLSYFDDDTWVTCT